MSQALLVILVLAADAWIGDPPKWPHMVRYMGSSIVHLEALLRPCAHSPQAQLRAGAVLTGLIVLGSLVAAALLVGLAGLLWPPLGWLAGLALAFQSISAGQLWREALRVEKPLARGDLATARRRLSMIVGRDTAALDEASIRRAAIETIAENLNDGVIAPLFYLALGGPLLSVAYKAVNTLDSMVAYKNERYLYFGRASALLDDMAGYAPARLSAVVISLAAALGGMDASGAWRVARTQHGAHSSPNSGWPEAAAAGALGLRFGGPNYYGGRLVDKPWINPGGRDPLPADLHAAVRLLALSALAAGLGAALVALALPWALPLP